MTTNLVLFASSVVTILATFLTFRRLLLLRDMFNLRQDLPRVMHESLVLGQWTIFLWIQIAYLSCTYELMRGSPMVFFHATGMVAQFFALGLATTLRLSVQPYVLDMDLIRAYKTHRDKKAEIRRLKRQSARR